MADTSELISDVTGMGAELPVAVPEGSELFPAGRTSKGVHSFPLYQVKVTVPPLIPADIAAEPFPLPSRFLFNGAAALLANSSCSRGGQAVPPAEGFHGIDG